MRAALAGRPNWLSVLGLVLALSAFGSAARALEVPALQARVNDYAALLEPAERAALESKLATHEQATGQQLYLLTVPSLDGDALEEFAIRVAEKWKVGRDKEDDGLIVFVVRDDHKLRIEVGYGLEGVVTDAFASQVIAEVLRPAFRERAYAAGLNQAFDLLMAKGKGIAVTPPKRASQRRASGVLPFVVFGLMALVWGIAWFGARKRPYRRQRSAWHNDAGVGWIGAGFGSDSSSSWSSDSSSSWGGDSGGGSDFSGGGGGDFGGGGASGDW